MIFFKKKSKRVLLSGQRSKLKLLGAQRIFRDLANKYAGFFMPIFLFELGRQTDLLAFLPLPAHQRGFLAIAFYFIIYGLMGAVMGIPLGRLMAKTGYRRTLVLAHLMRMLFFSSLYILGHEPSWMLFIVVALLDGFNSTIFWSGFWTLMSKESRRNRMGRNLGIVQLILQIVAVTSPAIAGAIASLAGITVLFLFGIIFTLMSLIAVLMMEREEVKYQVSLKEFRRWLSEKRYERLALALSGKFINDATVFIWPLYVFLLLGSIDKVGYLFTVSLFLAMLVVYFAGMHFDRSKSRWPFITSGGTISLVWLAKTQTLSVWGIAVADAIDRLATNIHDLYFQIAVLRRGKGSKAVAYFIYREVLANMARVIYWSLFAIFFLLYGEWKALFVVAALGALLSLLLRESKEVETEA